MVYLCARSAYDIIDGYRHSIAQQISAPQRKLWHHPQRSNFIPQCTPLPSQGLTPHHHSPTVKCTVNIVACIMQQSFGNRCAAERFPQSSQCSERWEVISIQREIRERRNKRLRKQKKKRTIKTERGQRGILRCQCLVISRGLLCTHADVVKSLFWTANLIS